MTNPPIPEEFVELAPIEPPLPNVQLEFNFGGNEHVTEWAEGVEPPSE
ncbi:hypothetical protein [Streptomyces sp. NPDC002644]